MRSSPTRTAAASPSATSRRRSRRCARRPWTDRRLSPTCSPASFRLVSLFATSRARPMTPLLLILLLIAMAATAYVLVRGVIAMASGKDVTGEQQQNYMRKRVLFQGIAIVIVILILVVAGQAGK